MSPMSAVSIPRQSTSLLLLLLLIATPISSGAWGGHDEADSDEPDPKAHVRMDPGQSVTMLGRHNFNTTVKQDHVDNWVVLFCVDWLDHCKSLWHDYRRMAIHWEQALAPNASSWQATAVRFAEVSCATDKPLCNENFVDDYPSVVRYKNGKFVKAWNFNKGDTSLSGSISKWIGKELSSKPAKVKASRPWGIVFKGYLKELNAKLSWKDPATAAIGYFVLFVGVAVFVGIVATGLEYELKSTLDGIATARKLPWALPALLPEMPKLEASRTIVRTTMEL